MSTRHTRKNPDGNLLTPVVVVEPIRAPTRKRKEKTPVEEEQVQVLETVITPVAQLPKKKLTQKQELQNLREAVNAESSKLALAQLELTKQRQELANANKEAKDAHNKLKAMETELELRDIVNDTQDDPSDQTTKKVVT